MKSFLFLFILGQFSFAVSLKELFPEDKLKTVHNENQIDTELINNEPTKSRSITRAFVKNSTPDKYLDLAVNYDAYTQEDMFGKTDARSWYIKKIEGKNQDQKGSIYNYLMDLVIKVTVVISEDLGISKDLELTVQPAGEQKLYRKLEDESYQLWHRLTSLKVSLYQDPIEELKETVILFPYQQGTLVYQDVSISTKADSKISQKIKDRLIQVLTLYTTTFKNKLEKS